MKKDFIREIPAMELIVAKDRDKMIVDAIAKANEIGRKGFEIKVIETHDDRLSVYTRIIIFHCERISIFERIALFLYKHFGGLGA